MKYLVEAPAALETTRRAVARALGYPRRGQVYRNGEHVTGDTRYDAGFVTQGDQVVELADDGTVAAIDIDTATEAKLSPALRARLVDAAALPQPITDTRARKAAEAAAAAPVEAPVDPAPVDPKAGGKALKR